MLDDQVGRTIAAGVYLASSERLCECMLLTISHVSTMGSQQERSIILHCFRQMLRQFAIAIAVRVDANLSPTFECRAYVSTFQLVHSQTCAQLPNEPPWLRSY